MTYITHTCRVLWTTQYRHIMVKYPKTPRSTSRQITRPHTRIVIEMMEFSTLCSVQFVFEHLLECELVFTKNVAANVTICSWTKDRSSAQGVYGRCAVNGSCCAVGNSYPVGCSLSRRVESVRRFQSDRKQERIRGRSRNLPLAGWMANVCT